jgi:uncharacterized tellurite resistance protein B-like protein
MHAMTARENLYYALGELAYAIARADGSVQKEEREKFHNIIVKELNNNEYDIDVSDIVFQLMDHEKRDSKSTYEWAMNMIKINSHYLSPELKQKFINVMENIAKAYPPVTVEEKNLIEMFKMDILPINGDPIYYEKR